MKFKTETHQEYLRQYRHHLYEEERSHNTIQKYIRDVTAFLRYLEYRNLTKTEVLLFKETLMAQYAPSSVNTIIAAVNGFLGWLELPQYKVKPVKIQKEIFISPEKELSQLEYYRLIQTAEELGQKKLSLMIQAICATGIRVSELQYITVSALHTGRTMVHCKGKNRTILLPLELCKILTEYCVEQEISEGSVFVTKNGKPLNRSNIWRMMKTLCAAAHVDENKVYPHNLRHLFAVTYYKMEKDIGKLADILGHSNINTTRIYTMETGATLAKQINKMNLTYYGKHIAT